MEQDLSIERLQPPHPALATPRALAVARLAGGERVLAVVAADAGNRARAAASHCLALDSALADDQALQVPALAWALWAWEQLHLELGELAIYCPGSPFDHLLGHAALLQGALPVFQVGAAEFAPPAGVEVLSDADAGTLLAELRKRTGKSPGVAAVDVRGKAEITDVLFEGLPRGSRMMLAAYRSSTLNIDFYNNVHRKGVLLRNGLCDPLTLLDGTAAGSGEYLARAMRLLLRRPELFRVGERLAA
jgi:hypothetical protein